MCFVYTLPRTRAYMHRAEVRCTSSDTTRVPGQSAFIKQTGSPPPVRLLYKTGLCGTRANPYIASQSKKAAPVRYVRCGIQRLLDHHGSENHSFRRVWCGYSRWIVGHDLYVALLFFRRKQMRVTFALTFNRASCPCVSDGN